MGVRERPSVDGILNCLEDIRIDNLLFLRYPGVRETYFQTLVVTALEQTREKDSINSKILKSLILKGEGFDKHDYHEPEVTQFFNLNQEKINAILRQTKSASLTSALFPLAEDLAMLFLSEEEAELIRRMETFFEQKQSRLEQELKQKEKEKGRLYRKKRKAQKELERTEAQCSAGDTPLKGEVEQAIESYEKAKKAVRTIKAEIKEFQKERRIKSEEQKQEIYRQKKIETISFFDFDAVPITFAEYQVEIEQNTKEALQTLCEVIREMNNQGGGERVNPKQLAHVYTAPENVFASKVIHHEIQTKIVFLLDSSGSMNGNAGIVLGGLQELTKSLDEIIDEHALEGQLDYALYAFNDKVWRMKSFGEYQIDWDSYVPAGGTEIADALRYVEEYLNTLDTSDTKVIIFCLTDGVIRKQDEEFLLNFSQYPVIFLGIRPGMAAHDLFRRYALNNLSELNFVLIHAIEENLRC